MNKIYLAIKFKEDDSNRNLVETIIHCIEENNYKASAPVRDCASSAFDPEELMRVAFKEIDESSALIAEFSEKGVGVGIEAGYACAKGLPIFVIAKSGSDVSETLRGIARSVAYYNDPTEIKEIVKNLLV